MTEISILSFAKKEKKDFTWPNKLKQAGDARTNKLSQVRCMQFHANGPC